MNSSPYEPAGHEIQISSNGHLIHLLQIEGLSETIIREIFARAQSFINSDGRIVHTPLLNRLTTINIFFEPSTRTRISFELAAKKLSSDVVNFDAAQSSTLKGESLLDTLRTIDAMQSDLFVIRHSENYITHFLAQHVSPFACVINAGDGTYAHPTQALLDTFTIQHHKPNFTELKVVIVGDIIHSRVAHSLLHALKILKTGVICAIGPKALVPEAIEGVLISYDLDSALDDADVIVMLRLQKERMQSADIPNEADYAQQYGLNSERLKKAKANAIVMHPGPINRGVEISSEVADGPQSVVLQQVTHGVAIRMAVMAVLAENRLAQRKP